MPDADFAVGDRVGIAWLRHTCGHCRYCLRGRENLCPQSRYTGWDADGGYAEFATVPAAFAHPLPAGYTDDELAPLLCAGIIGYRSLMRAELPDGRPAGDIRIRRECAHHRPGRAGPGRRGARDDARSRTPANWHWRSARRRPRAPTSRPPVELDAAILFAPVGDLVLPALEALDRGGTLAIAGIHLSDIPALNYQRHLFQERQVRSVSSNTRADAREFLDFAGRHHIAVTTPRYPMSRADRALADLAGGRISGAAVLTVD